MPECQECGSENVAWRQAKNGSYYLIDTKRPHFCKAKKKGQVSRPLDPVGNPIATEVVAGLVGLGYKQVDAKRYVAAAGAAPDAKTLLLAAFAVRDVEMAALKGEG